MKALHKISILFIALNLWILLQSSTATAQVSVSFQVFYDNLSPYGSWVQNPSYGYVWIPRVAVGFSPYHTNGYWAYTDYGWTWVSNYSWGWAPFHYGRWYYDPYYGWVWVPDNEWGPAWVTWRSSADYYGWAPIGPGISISVAYSSGYRVPNNHWTFVRNRDFGHRNITNYYVNNSTNTTIINNATIINNVRKDKTRNVNYAMGPDRTDVQKRTGKAITSMAVKDRSQPGQNNNSKELQLFRPRVQKNNASGSQPKPARVVDMKDVKRQQAEPIRGNSKIERPQKQLEKPQNQLSRPARTESPKINQGRETAPRVNEPKGNQSKGNAAGRENQNRNQAAPAIKQERPTMPQNNSQNPVQAQPQRMNRPDVQQQRRNAEQAFPRGQGNRNSLPVGGGLIR